MNRVHPFRRLILAIAALLCAATLGGCFYVPGPDPYSAGLYRGYAPAYGYAPVPYPYTTPGYAPAATDYNPVSGSRTGSH